MQAIATHWNRKLTLLALVAASWSGPAWAEVQCPETRSPRDARRLAGREFAAGQRLYDSGDYSAAIERFECSFRLVRHRDTLFNIARSAEAAGDLEYALDRYETLLTRYSGDPDRDDIEARIRRLEERLEARRPVELPPEPPPPESTPTSYDDWREEPPPQGASRRSGARTAAWVVFALGAAAAIAGSTLVGVAASENEAYLERRDVLGWTRDALFDAHQRGLALEGSGWASLGVGAAALVAAIVLFFVPSREREASRLPLEGLGHRWGQWSHM